MTSNASGDMSWASTEFRQERSSAPALYTGMTTLTRGDPRSAVAAFVQLGSEGNSEHRRATPPRTVNRGCCKGHRVPTLASCDGPFGGWKVASALRGVVELVAGAVVRVRLGRLALGALLLANLGLGLGLVVCAGAGSAGGCPPCAFGDVGASLVDHSRTLPAAV